MRLIDGDELIKRLQDTIDFNRKHKVAITLFSKQHISSIIDNMKTVDAVKHGHWSQYAEPHEDGKGLYICSVCNELNVMYDDEYKFCPSCGAKMDAKPGGDSLDGEKAK